MTYGKDALQPLMDALNDSTRRAVLARIRQAPASVQDIADELPVSRPAVSQHLKRLLDAELVTVSAEGTRRVYHFQRTGFGPLRAYLDEMWDDALASFAAYTEENEPGDDQ